MVHVLSISRTLQATIEVLNAAKDSIQDTERINTSERSDANVARAFQLVENQAEAACSSFQVRSSLHFFVPLHTDCSLPQDDVKVPNEAQDRRKQGPQYSIQVCLPSLASRQ